MSLKVSHILFVVSLVKRSFYKSSLKYHPDRHKENKKGLATEQFQVISRAFAILSDKESRAVYDETGYSAHISITFYIRYNR